MKHAQSVGLIADTKGLTAIQQAKIMNMTQAPRSFKARIPLRSTLMSAANSNLSRISLMKSSAGRVHPWNYGDHQNEYVNVADTLRAAMTMNPALKVFVANGYYDLATPFLASEYTFSHLGLDPSLQDNITMAYYQAGHMMYIDQAELQKMKSDLDAYLDSVLS